MVAGEPIKATGLILYLGTFLLWAEDAVMVGTMLATPEVPEEAEEAEVLHLQGAKVGLGKEMPGELHLDFRHMRVLEVAALEL